MKTDDIVLYCLIDIPLGAVVSFFIVLLLVVKLERIIGVAERIELIAGSCANISLTGAKNSPV